MKPRGGLKTKPRATVHITLSRLSMERTILVKELRVALFKASNMTIPSSKDWKGKKPCELSMFKDWPCPPIWGSIQQQVQIFDTRPGSWSDLTVRVTTFKAVSQSSKTVWLKSSFESRREKSSGSELVKGAIWNVTKQTIAKPAATKTLFMGSCTMQTASASTSKITKRHT